MSAARQKERTARLAAGAVLLGVGIFLAVSFYNVLELLLYGAAGLMGLAGLVAVPVLLLKRSRKTDVALAAGVAAGGIALAVHDLFPGGIVLHLLAAAAALGSGAWLVVQGLRMKRANGR